MPRAPSDKRAEAEKLFKKGMKLTDIAKKLDVPEGTVRSWKNRGKWNVKSSKKDNCNVAKNEINSNATLQKKKRGGQQGNKNSVGHTSSVPKRNRNAETHGAYSKVYWDTLDNEELGLVESMDDTEELQLIMQLQMFAVRERRLMKSIKRYREMETENHGLSIKSVSRTKKLEDLANIEGEILGTEKYKKVTETNVTNTEAVINSIMILEAELTRVQKAKTKAIEVLSKYRLEKVKIESESAGNDVVDDWIVGVLGEDKERM